MHHVLRVSLAALALLLPLHAQGFVNFESTQVHPLRVSDDGTRLYAVQTVAGRLAVYGLADPDRPVLLREIPVGLEPVSVTERVPGEVWVANLLSDTVSVVDAEEGRILDTLRCGDEPSDVAFAGGRAFVSVATRDLVRVYDAVTRVEIGSVAIPGKDPRALAPSPDGQRVWVLAQRSGNGTTILPAELAPAPPPPLNPSLPDAPHTGLVVAADDPQWIGQVPQVADEDLFGIDVATLQIDRVVSGVGTTNFDLAVHPTSGEVWVAATDARNLVRFEPALRGHAIDSLVTAVPPGPGAAATRHDLNAGLSYASLPDLAAKAVALAEPTGLVIDAAQNRLYVAAQGTDRIGVVDLATGAVLQRHEVGTAVGATVDTASKRGPRALALHPSAARLYVFNRLSDTLSTLDAPTGAILSEVAIGSRDPMPASLRLGRKFLYDAKLSGNGTMSCASCHVDGDGDGIAWDLGDPGGSMAAAPTQPFPFSIGLADFHPMKGPMVTQTLRGLEGVGPLHWRGDREDFAAFNGAFDSLLGGDELSAADMSGFAAWGTSVAFPPNPNQNLDRSLETSPPAANQQEGLNAYLQPAFNVPLVGTISCVGCHGLPDGTNGQVIALQINGMVPQQMKVPQLRNLYRKTGVAAAGPSKSGFGFSHDGVFSSLDDFFDLGFFDPWPQSKFDDIVEFMMVFDSGTAPTVGFQVFVAPGEGLASAADLSLLETRAFAGDCDLVVRRRGVSGTRAWAYHFGLDAYVPDRAGEPALGRAALLADAQAAGEALVFTGVPPGTGALALDGDDDGVLDGDEGQLRYGAPSPGCDRTPTVELSSEPALGNASFSLVSRRGFPGASCNFGIANLPASLEVLGFTLLADVFAAPVDVVEVGADARGTAVLPVPLPDDPAFQGVTVYVQAVWWDPCTGWYVGSEGLAVTVQ